MARLRNRIRKADYFSDGELLRWPRDKRTTYSGLWALAEDSGCLEDDPLTWKVLLWPSPLDADISVEVLAQWRDELVADGKLIPYEADGKRCLYLRSFHKHELPRNPQRPDLPLPPWLIHDTTAHKRGDRTVARNAFNVDWDRVPERNGDSTVTVPSSYGDRSITPVPSRPVPSRSLRALSDSGESAPPGNGSKQAKVRAPKDEDWQQRADAVLASTDFPSDYQNLAELLAAENKSGKATLSRVVRELYEPLLEVEHEVGGGAMRAGLRAAITKGAPNVTYVKKAAVSHATRPGAVAVTSKDIDRADYDDFLTGGEL